MVRFQVAGSAIATKVAIECLLSTLADNGPSSAKACPLHFRMSRGFDFPVMRAYVFD